MPGPERGLRFLFRALADFVFPPVCIGCDREVMGRKQGRDFIPGPVERVAGVHRAPGEPVSASGRPLFMFGNGGSSANASHIVNDMLKSTIRPDRPRMKLICLSDNVPTLTAYANDVGYDVVFAEPLAAVLEIFEQVRVRPMDSVAILGDGKLGLLAAMTFSFRHTGPLLLIGHHPSNWQRVPNLDGIHEDHLGPEHRAAFDLVIEASGRSSGLEEALRITRPRGTIVLKSTMERPEPVDLTPAVIHEITVIGSRCGRLPAAIRFLQKTETPVERLIEATYPLERADQAWQHALRPGTLKICLNPLGRSE